MLTSNFFLGERKIQRIFPINNITETGRDGIPVTSKLSWIVGGRGTIYVLVSKFYDPEGETRVGSIQISVS